ncbi:hypothetical protein F4604DRAFT_1926003 [Suillus subluteus]|nr:hypothetical protein F4604DRAFT_1926003 [Suillus subluteus]
MSAPVQTSLASLKAATAQLVDIISGARHIPAGTGEAHLALTAKATTLVGAIVRDFQNGPYMPGVVASCSKELLRVRSMTPRVWPNWHSIGHDDPRVSKHAWLFQVPEVGGSRKCKSPLISVQPSEPPKSAMKSRKRVKSTPNVKSSLVVESEDDDDAIIKPILSGVPEVVLPQSSTIIVRTPHSPRSPGSPKKQAFGPASLTAGGRPEVPETSGSHPAPASNPPAILTFDITIPGPNNPCYYCSKEDWPCQSRLDKRTSTPCLSCVRCATKKLKCQPASMGSPPPRTRGGGKFTSRRMRSRTPAPNAPSASQSRPRTRSQSRGPSHHPATPAPATQEVQSRGRRKTNNAKRAATPSPAPAPAPAPALAPAPPAIVSSSSRVPPAALDVPMPDLHSMAITIRDGAARIALLETRVREQDDKIDTLQRLHESLRRKVVDRHPSFPLPDSPAPATFLLNQSITPSMSPLPSALPNLINLDMGVMEPSSLKVEDASDMVGLIFEPSPVQPDGPQPSSKIEDPDDPGNLVPEYNSVSEEMDVEVKDETSGGEVDMAT